MIDVLYCCSNRLEYTQHTLPQLVTTLGRVGRLTIYIDCDIEGTENWIRNNTSFCKSRNVLITKLGGPVAVMNDFLDQSTSDIFAKVDNDLIVCPGWIEIVLEAMNKQPEYDLVGIEPRTADVKRGGNHIVDATHIGGIGLMRRRAFTTKPVPNGRFGFTEWQHENQTVKKGWITPSLPVFLLDHLPFEPFKSLGIQYCKKNWQRPSWGYYSKEYENLWKWYLTP